MVTKTSHQRQKEAELTTYKYLVENSIEEEEEDVIESLERIFQLKQKGILSEEEFISIKKKMME